MALAAAPAKLSIGVNNGYQLHSRSMSLDARSTKAICRASTPENVGEAPIPIFFVIFGPIVDLSNPTPIER